MKNTKYTIKERLVTLFPNSSYMKTYVEDSRGRIVFAMRGTDDDAKKAAQQFIDKQS